MHRLVVISTFLASLSHGQRQVQESQIEESQRPTGLKALASLLTSSNPEAGFQLSGFGAHPARGNPRFAGSQKPLRPNSPLMADFYLTPPDDPSIPQEGMPVPAKDTILRACRVTKVDESGAWVEVDPNTGLNGFIYPMGLDNAYVKNLQNTFRVGDLLDAKVIEVSGISGRLLLSRKILMDEEGWEKHELPMDGRERPKRDTSIPSKKPKPEGWGWGDPEDPCCPPPDAVVPPDGTILRELPVVKVTEDGVYCMVDDSQNPPHGLQGFIYPMGVDSAYIKDLRNTIKVGDKLDAISMAVSRISGKFMLTRKQLMDREGWEKHELPDDGRERPLRHR